MPNILINGKSIGGGDDIAAFDAEDKLVETIKNFGGKRIMEVSRAAAQASEPKVARKLKA